MWDEVTEWFYDLTPFVVPVALVVLLVVIATAALIVIGDLWGGE